MAVNVSNRKPNMKNLVSHAKNTTKKKQALNTQVYRLENGKKVRVSNKELRTIKKADKVKDIA